MWAKQQCGARACCRRRVFLLVPPVAGLYELGVRAAYAGLLSVEMLDSEIEKAARSRIRSPARPPRTPLRFALHRYKAPSMAYWG